MTNHSKNSFNKIINAPEVLVLVFFFANWSAICQMIKPFLVSISKQFKDRVAIIEIDTDKNKNIAEDYRIYRVPTVFFFKKGEVIDRIENIFSEKELIAKVLINL